MRNLKRVLSLALASAMLLGMMVMGAGAADTKKTAADLTDMDKITNKEAVSLLVDLGIIEGKSDGSYAPTEIVDRATMAKLVYFVLEGNTDASIYKGGTALKDTAGHWAEGFINYCYSLNIIAGDGAGSFLPANKVTTVAAAKMLLVSLGYDAADRGYVNDAQWSINIMKDAQKTGLMDGVDQKTNEELTRDNAALMIFNALMANTVVANYDRDMGEKYISSYTTGNTLGYDTYSLVAVTAKVDSISDGKAVITTVSDDTVPGITAANISGKIAASTNVVGQNVTVYVKAALSFDKDGNATKATFKEIYSSSLQSSTSVLLATSMKGLTLEKLTEKKLAGKTNKDYLVSLDTETAPVFFLNGDASDEDMLELNASAAKGIVVEFYDANGNGLADVVKVYKKSIATLSADPKTKTDDDGNITVLLKPISNSYISAVGYEDMAKGDVVLYYKDAADVYHVELADSFTGTVDAVKSTGEVRVDGKYYAASGLKSDALKDWKDFENEYTFYTDNAGNVIKAATTGEVTDKQYAVVLESAWVSGGGVGASKYMEAKVLFSDGTTEIVKVDKIGGLKVIASTSTPATDDDGNATEVKYEELKWTNGVYTYTVSSEKYSLTAVTEGKVNEGAISNTAKFATGFTANNKTIFVVEKGGDTKTYASYTGYANVPKMAKASGWAYTDGKTSTLATYVFLTTEAYSDDAPEGLVFIKDTKSYSTDKDGNKGYAIYDANGDEDTLWVNGTLPTTHVFGYFTVGALTEKVANVDNVEYQAPLAVRVLGDGIVEFDTDKVASYDTDTIMVVADLNKDGKTIDSVGSADPDSYTLDTDLYTYTGLVLTSNDTATYIYLISAAKDVK